MSTVRRRRLAATALATTALLALGACGTGFSAQTNQVYQAGTGANHRGEMDVLNTLLVANDDGSATLSAGIVNNTKDEQRLASVTVTTLDDKPLTVASTKMILSLPADKLTTIGGIADAGGFAVLKDAAAGDYVKVTLTFERRGSAASRSRHPSWPAPPSTRRSAARPRPSPPRPPRRRTQRPSPPTPSRRTAYDDRTPSGIQVLAFVVRSQLSWPVTR